MTINVALVTNEALILGCDSIASTTRYYLDPAKIMLRDDQGNGITDADGKWQARFEYSDLSEIVTNAWGGVQKMFMLCGGNQNDHTTVAAVTSGLATLLDRTMNNFAGEFRNRMEMRAPRCTSVQQVVDEFLAFMGGKYDEEFNNPAEIVELRPDIEFLVGGYGLNDALPSLFRVKLKDKSKALIYSPDGDKTGLAWAGQANTVQRILRGYDAYLAWQLGEKLTNLYSSMSEATLRIVREILQALNAQMPEGIDSDLPDKPDLEGIFKSHRLDIDYQNMPLQDAVDFVAYLVNLESGKNKFVRGIPTVGGRTHVGIMTRGEGFRFLNPPTLTHKSTGFASDF